MGNVIDRIEAGFNRLAGWLIALVAASIGLFAVLIPFNLVLINLHYGGMWWLHEAIEYALYIGVFIGAPWVLQQGAHVRVDLAAIALPKTAAVFLERLIDAIGCGLCIVLFVYGLRAAMWEFEDGTLPDKDLRIANWAMLAVFAAAFLMLAIEFLFRLRRAGKIVDEEVADATKGAF